MSGKILGLFSAAGLVLALAAAPAMAQSSGSFQYSAAANTACVLNGKTGAITGGVQCSAQTTGPCSTNADCTNSGSTPGTTCSGAIACLVNTDCPTDAQGNQISCVNNVCQDTGECTFACGQTGEPACNPAANCIGSTGVAIKTSSGSGNVFLVRPSAVVGLLTDVTVSSKQFNSVSGSSTSSAYAGVDFQVNVTSGPNSPTVTPAGSVTYDARFIQISTNLFQGLSATCLASQGGCFITFNESTVSAHSFDWIIGGNTPLTSGTYDVTAQWTSSLGDMGIASSMTCVGPVNLTIQQNKIFKPSAKAQALSF